MPISDYETSIVYSINNHLKGEKEVNNLINTYPIVVGYSRKKFTDQLNMTNNEMIDHCLDSGVDLLRLHLDLSLIHI